MAAAIVPAVDANECAHDLQTFYHENIACF